ncbi:MAG TPA: 2-amino-4-hydroxy-6-hydroxymethyldihydropteridine diphosphokinase [Actinomycetota bacterium]|nr:2-amino-4-hydroxy-6-hydroxymethyldihydropteridine diphosphokinase [Actinomycetota bacterium]
MRAYLALGANLGDRAATLASVPAALLGRSIFVTNASRVFETTPVGGPDDQPDYLNQVLEIQTMCSPREVLDACRAVEFAHGRERDRRGEPKNEPRTLDIDFLAIDGGETIDDHDLIVPHPRLHERAFVLVPLAEIAPDLEIPGHGTVTALLVGLNDTDGVRPVQP